jgi:hypothetical protein
MHALIRRIPNMKLMFISLVVRQSILPDAFTVLGVLTFRYVETPSRASDAPRSPTEHSADTVTLRRRCECNTWMPGAFQNEHWR